MSALVWAVGALEKVVGLRCLAEILVVQLSFLREGVMEDMHVAESLGVHLVRWLLLVGYPWPARHAKADVTIFQCLQTLADFQAEAFDIWLCAQAIKTKIL